MTNPTPKELADRLDNVKSDLHGIRGCDIDGLNLAAEYLRQLEVPNLKCEFEALGFEPLTVSDAEQDMPTVTLRQLEEQTRVEGWANWLDDMGEATTDHRLRNNYACSAALIRSLSAQLEAERAKVAKLEQEKITIAHNAARLLESR